MLPSPWAAAYLEAVPAPLVALKLEEGQAACHVSGRWQTHHRLRGHAAQLAQRGQGLEGRQASARAQVQAAEAGQRRQPGGQGTGRGRRAALAV